MSFVTTVYSMGSDRRYEAKKGVSGESGVISSIQLSDSLYSIR